MGGFVGIVVAGIGAFAAITGSYFTAQATANSRVNDLDTEVQIAKTTQALQYKEVTDWLERIDTKLDKALK